MQPLSHSTSSSGLGKCQETSSKCVIWDGPDINCLGVQLCKGQSIEVMMYNTAKTLCDLLETLKITDLDLKCITQPVGSEPQDYNDLTQLIIDKLCEINGEVELLQNTTTAPVTVDLPVCDSLPGLEDCPARTTLTYEVPNPNGGTPITITKLVLIDPVTNTSPAANYFAEKICELLCRMTTAEDNITQLQLDVENIQNQISGALPSVNVPACISPIPTLPLADPTNPSAGAVVAIADKLCDIINEITDNPTGGNYPMDTTCIQCGTTTPAELSTLPPVGSYPGSVVNTLADLGAIPNPQYLWQTVRNMMVAICDLRNFACKVNSFCCPAPCNNITVDIGAACLNSGRTSVAFFLNATIVDQKTFSPVTANFANFASPGSTDFAPQNWAINGPNLVPPQWDIHKSVNITICDTAVPQTCVTNNVTYLDDYATAGFFVAIDTSTLDSSTDYIVSYTVDVLAPDKSFCTFSESTTLETTCDNQPVTGVTVFDIGANGFSVSFTPAVVGSGTILQSYTFTITTSGGSTIEIENIEPGWETQGYLIYPDEASYAGSAPPSPFGSTSQWLIQELDPNTTYTLSIVAVYNCGQSGPVNTSVTTLVGMRVSISEITSAPNCIAQSGVLTFIPPTGATVSANAYVPITFDGVTPKEVVISGSPNQPLQYIFTTLSLKSALYSTTSTDPNCPVVDKVRCWGPPSLHLYPSTGGPVPQLNPPALIQNRDEIGCYDYITSNFSASNIGFTGPALITNINDGGGNTPSNTNVGTYQYSYTSAAGAVTLPSTPTIGTFNIINNLHAINNSQPVQLKIIINDNSNYLANNGLVWFPGSDTATLATSIASFTTGYSNQVNNLISTYVPAGPGYPTVQRWTTAGTYAAPVAVPVFMRIVIAKFGSSGGYTPVPAPTPSYVSPQIVDVNSYWLQFPNIASTGFVLPPSIPINVRDKVYILFSGGVSNATNTNPDYVAGAPGLIPTINQQMYSRVELFQDPYNGVFPDVAPLNLQTGPYAAYAPAPISTIGSWSYADANTGRLVGASTVYGVADNFSFQQFQFNASRIEFVASGDMTVTWNLY